MARFLISVWTAPGHVNTALALANGLRGRGHEVAIFSGPEARANVESDGVRFFPFESMDFSELGDYISRRTHHATWWHAWKLRRYVSLLVTTIPNQVNDIAHIMTTWQPDVIVSDYTMWGPSLVLRELHRTPVASFTSLLTCPLPRALVEYGDHLPFMQRVGSRARQFFINVLKEQLFAKRARRVVNASRQSFGLSPLSGRLSDALRQVPLLLVPSMRELDFKRDDLPSSVHYVGPFVWNKPTTAPPATWLEQVPTDQPWVHVTEGTVAGRNSVLLRAAAQGLAGLPIQVIMTTCGRDPDELNLGAIAPNIWVKSWVSHSDITPRTDVFVTTGGAGAVMAALEAGVPQVVVPTELDKPVNARMIEQSGAGLRLSPRRCTPARLRETVMRVLKEPEFRDRARHMAQVAAAYRGPALAAELLESLLNSPPPEHDGRGGTVSREGSDKHGSAAN